MDDDSDDWMCDEYEMDNETCQWLVITPNENMNRDSTEEIWIVFEVTIAGTSVTE